MPQRKTIIWIAVGAIILIGIVYAAFFRKPKVQYQTADVQRGTVSQTVAASGTLKANDTINLNFEASGRIKDIRIKVGQKVATGDVLATLDDTNLQLALAEAKANLDKAKAQAGANDDSIHTAQVTVDNAKKLLNDTKDLNSSHVDAADQAEKDTKNTLDDAQKYYDQVKNDNGASSSTTKSAKLTLDSAQASYNDAKKAKDVAGHQADLNETSAQNGLDTAKANLSATESKFVVASDNATVRSFSAQYEAALNNLGKSVLRSPASGIIKAVNFKVGEVSGLTAINSNTGAINSNTFAEMISYDFIFEAQVPESDIAKLAVGQTAELTFDAFSADEKFSGKIVSIEPSSTVVQSGVDYVVKVALDKSDPRFKDGMSADIDFQITQKDNILFIPERTIQTAGNNQTVQVLNVKNQVEKRNITTGLKGDWGVIEVVSGLSEGEKVVVSTS